VSVNHIYVVQLQSLETALQPFFNVLAVDGKARVDVRLRGSQYLGGDDYIFTWYFKCLQDESKLAFSLTGRVYFCCVEVVDAAI
jgi:hypothetical protein